MPTNGLKKCDVIVGETPLLLRRGTSKGEQVVFFNRLDLTHKPLDPASASANQGSEQGDLIPQEAVGNTPLIYLRGISEETGCTILGKAE